MSVQTGIPMSPVGDLGTQSSRVSCALSKKTKDEINLVHPLDFQISEPENGAHLAHNLDYALTPLSVIVDGVGRYGMMGVEIVHGSDEETPLRHAEHHLYDGILPPGYHVHGDDHFPTFARVREEWNLMSDAFLSEGWGGGYMQLSGTTITLPPGPLSMYLSMS